METRAIHEASSSCDHDILDIREWLELGGTSEDRRIFPDAVVFEEVVASAIGTCMDGESKLLRFGKFRRSQTRNSSSVEAANLEVCRWRIGGPWWLVSGIQSYPVPNPSGI